MPHQRFEPSSYSEQPWRNGQGTTTQLLAADDGAGGFLWRLSIAPVLSDGPFSFFCGYDRTLVLLEGRALTLRHGEHGEQVLDQPLTMAHFSGDWATTGHLGAGPIRDFNIMTRRERYRAQVQTGELASLAEQLDRACVEVLYAPYAELTLRDDLGTHLLPRHHCLRRVPGHGPMIAAGGALIQVVLTPL